MKKIKATIRRTLFYIWEGYLSFFGRRLKAFIVHQWSVGLYPQLSLEEFKNFKKSETVFIFASGFSINDIQDQEWRMIERHDTLAFSEFARCKKVRVDFHILAEAMDVPILAELFRQNPNYQNTVYIAQEGWRAIVPNELIGWRMLRRGAPMLRYRRKTTALDCLPTRSLAEGVVHRYNSVSSSINLAMVLGWKKIVLVGVDLYDKRYFFVPANETREREPEGITYETVYPSGNQLIQLVRMWKPEFDRLGIKVEAYNPKSRLTEVLDVFKRESLK